MYNKPSLLIFDVNETLLDLEPIKMDVNNALGSASAFDFWFGKLLQFSLVETITEHYCDFGEIGAAVLKMSAQKFSATISEERIQKILETMLHLNPYAEVPEALEQLNGAGYKMVALSNGGQLSLVKQLKNAGIDRFFENIYSVESVRKFKPHPKTYEYVLQMQMIEAKDAMLIAAHAWDIAGARRAGLQTAFLQRPGKSLYPLEKQPEMIGNSLSDIAKALLSIVN